MKQLFRLLLVASSVLALSGYASAVLWTHSPGPVGSRISAVLFSDSIQIAGSSEEGLYTSTDQGMQWKHVDSGFASYGDSTIRSLARHGDHLYAGTERGPYVSIDGGATWTIARTGIDTAYPATFCWLFVHDTIWIGTGEDVYYSVDSAKHWRTTSFIVSGLDVQIVYALAKHEDTLFAATSNGVCFTIKNGADWTFINEGFPDHAQMRSLLIWNGVLYVGTKSYGIYRRDWDSQTWFPVNNTLSKGTTVTALAKRDSSIIACTPSRGVLVSDFSDSNWKTMNVGIDNPNVLGMQMSGDTIILGTAGGVFLTSNAGELWEKRNVGFPCLSPNAICNYGDKIIHLSPNGAYQTSDDVHWIGINQGIENNLITCAIEIGDTLLAGTFDWGGMGVDSNGRCFALLDSNSERWVRRDSMLDDYWVYCFVKCGSYVCAGTSSGVYRSSNAGATWTHTAKGIEHVNIGDMLFVNGILYATNCDSSEAGEIFMSADSGITWTLMNQNKKMNCVVAVGTFGNMIVVSALREGLFMTSDGGTTWDSLPLGNNQVWSMKALDGLLYLGCDTGIFACRIPDPHFINVCHEVSGQWVYSIEQFGNKMYLGTKSGVWISTTEALQEAAARSAVLEARGQQVSIDVYPNPSFGNSTISWSAPHSRVDKVAVINLMGEEVFSSTSVSAVGSKCTIDLSALNLSTGTYFCRISNQAGVATKPFAVFK